MAMPRRRSMFERPSIPSAPPPGRSFAIVLVTTFAAFSAFYAPQPLLPHFSREFEVSPTTAALLLTISFVFLAIAPLGFGVVLQRFSAQRLLVTSTALLAMLQFAFAAAPSFGWLLGARTLEGALYPAIFTSAVTYCSRAGEREAIARRVSIYIGTTIVGGLSGRLVGGFVSSWFGWRTSFVLLGILLVGCSVALRFAARDASLPRDGGGNFAATRSILATREFRAGFALIFVVFFTFSACLNALPFRLVDLEPDIPSSRISLVYLGYLIGVAIALNIGRIGRIVGGPLRTMGIALGLFVLGLALMWTRSANALIAIGFLTSAGMFTVHATLSGYLNGLRPAQSGLVNGLYISIYYSAGAAGSVLPLWVYNTAGWSAFLIFLLVTCTVGFVPLALLARRRTASDVATR